MHPWWIFLVFIVFSTSVTCDSYVRSAFNVVNSCKGFELEECLNERAISALLDAANLSDIQNSSKDGRSYHTTIEEHLIERLFSLSGVPEEMFMDVQTGRSRTFKRPWKYLVPFLMGVMLKLATFVPMVLIFLTFIAKNALISSNLALLFTGLNIALKYWNWHPKWGEQTPFNQGHYGQSDFGNLHGYNQHSFGQQSQEDLGTLSHQSDAPYKTRRVYVTA